MVYIWQKSWWILAKNKADIVQFRIDIAAQYEYMKYSVLLYHNA